MGGPGLGQQPVRLVGRAGECAVIDQLLAGAQAGTAGALVVRGELYLSPRTVDYHLRKVFTKLGIASRAELIRDGLPHSRPA